MRCLKLRDSVTIRGVLGHDIFPTGKHQKAALAAVPLPRLVASLINARQKPNKSGTALLDAYGRSISLLVAGGYMYPAFVHTVQGLYEKVLEMIPTMAADHKSRVVQMTHSSGLGLADDEPILEGVFFVQGSEFLVRPPPTVSALQALRLNPSTNSVSEDIKALLQSVKVSGALGGASSKSKSKASRKERETLPTKSSTNVASGDRKSVV